MSSLRISNQAILGLFIVIIGALLLISTTGIANVGGFFRWIPSLFILFGLWRLIAGGFRHIFGPVLIIVIAGIVQLALLDIDIGNLWPVVLIIIGLSILFGGSRLRRRGQDVYDSDEVNSWGSFGSSVRIVSSKNFKGGQATAFMGGVEIDLRQAEVADKPATIEATSIMGGIEVKVRPEWNVVIDTLTLMGGTEDKRNSLGSDMHDSPDLVITGLVLMAGLEVKD